jgi:hypothetical protein
MLRNEEVLNPLMELEQAQKDGNLRRNFSKESELVDPVGAVMSRITDSICQRQSLINENQKKIGLQNLIARNGLIRRNSPDR